MNLSITHISEKFWGLSPKLTVTLGLVVIPVATIRYAIPLVAIEGWTLAEEVGETAGAFLQAYAY